MENNSNRRLLFAIGTVMLFVTVVLVWYFFYAKPLTTPTITGTNDPFPTQKNLPRFQFLTWGQNDTSSSTTEVTDPLAVPLIKVWDKPATGQTFVTQNILKEVFATTTNGTTTVEIKKTVRATSTILLFVDRITGYVYGYPIETGKVFQISNSVIPGIYDAYFFNGGKGIIMRYIDQEKNIVTGVVATVPDVKENEIPLPLQNIQYLTSEVTSIATNLKKNKVSYIVSTTNGSAIYTITPKGPVFVVSSPFKDWTLSYGGDSLFVTSKPSAYVGGGTFDIPSFQSELNEKTGLMSNPGPDRTMINSMWSTSGLATFLSDDGNLKSLSFLTLASKCSWGEKQFLVCAVPRTIPQADEGLPDDWFQGRVSFNDDIFVIDTKTGERYSLYAFTQENGLFDVTNISIAPKNEFLGFNKKQDASLWLLNLDLLGGD
jgi:hypothetical protein